MEEEEKKQEQIALIPEEQLNEILSILFPWGYSHYKEVFYTGVSPFIGEGRNVITIVANDPIRCGSVFSICMEKFDDGSNVADCIGYYAGIMKLIAPELHSPDEKFLSNNILDFNWASDYVRDNAFPAKVIPKVFDV